MSEEIFQRLLELVHELCAETATLTAQESELQLWYNRGYADGMVEVMRSLGFTRRLEAAGLVVDRPIEASEELLPWGKAYRHGFEMGKKETAEVL